jgi:hypothetical protein
MVVPGSGVKGPAPERRGRSRRLAGRFGGADGAGGRAVSCYSPGATGGRGSAWAPRSESTGSKISR